MNKFTRSKKRALSAEINVVPYIDVMLVLLVIFMITAPLLSQGIHVNLPTASTKPLPQKKAPIIVSVDAKGQYYLNTYKLPSKPLSTQQLMSETATQITQAQKNKDNRPIYVKGDKNANYGQVVKAMALLKKAGAHEVGLITSSADLV